MKTYRNTKYQIDHNGVVFNSVTNKPIKAVKKPTGYHEVRLSNRGKVVSLSHHRVVWEAWNGVIPKKMQINHIDGDRSNNKISNLELVTPADNQLKRLNLRKGISVNTAKLKDADIIDIRTSGKSTSELTSVYPVGKSTINRIKRGFSWKHV